MFSQLNDRVQTGVTCDFPNAAIRIVSNGNVMDQILTYSYMKVRIAVPWDVE